MGKINEKVLADIAKAKRIFNALNLEDWEIIEGEPGIPSGQAVVLKVQNKKDISRQGAFRTLKNPDKQAKKRFDRELKVLTNPQYRHDSIVEIYNWSEEYGQVRWYISRLGDSFVAYWNSRREALKNDQAQLLHEALEIVKRLAGGLIKPHLEGVIHRDIKPENIVMIDGFPALIDFGVVFVDDLPRLTRPREGVGNRGFSPVKTKYPIDEPTPWEDIYPLAQVLMWMVSERPNKTWDQPMDWRYIKYPKGFTDLMENQMDAFMAISMEELLSPKNAADFVEFMNAIFISKEKIFGDSSEFLQKVQGHVRDAEIRGKIRKQDSELTKERIYKSLQRDFSIFKIGFDQVEECMNEIHEMLKKSEGIRVNRTSFQGFPDRYYSGFAEQVMQQATGGNIITKEVYELTIGPADVNQSFSLNVQCIYDGEAVLSNSVGSGFLPLRITVQVNGGRSIQLKIASTGVLFMGNLPRKKQEIYDEIEGLISSADGWILL